MINLRTPSCVCVSVRPRLTSLRVRPLKELCRCGSVVRAAALEKAGGSPLGPDFFFPSLLLSNNKRLKERLDKKSRFWGGGY